MKSVKIILSLLLCIAICLPLCACRARERKYSETYFDCFDSFASITVYTDSKSSWESCRASFEEYVYEYHRLLDAYNAYDGVVNLYSVNHSQNDEIEVSDELMDFLLRAKEVYRLTDGYVSVSMGSVTSIWKKAIADKALPHENELIVASQHTDANSVILDGEKNTVLITDPQLRLDAGALGKGFAAQRICEKLAEQGYDSFLINLGGTLSARGEKPDGTPWTGGVQSPDGDGAENVSVSLSDTALSTSGSYQRGFELDGVTYHHIIDPTTLYPPNEFVSVSLLCDDALIADALSTALFCMSHGDGKALADTLEDTEVMWIFSDGEISQTDGFN